VSDTVRCENAERTRVILSRNREIVHDTSAFNFEQREGEVWMFPRDIDANLTIGIGYAGS
jgi:hypothetical protein